MAKTLIGATQVTDVTLVAFEDDTMGGGQHQVIAFRVSGTWCSLGTDGPDVMSYKLPLWLVGLLEERLKQSGVELKSLPSSELDEEPGPVFVDRAGMPPVAQVSPATGQQG